MTSRGLDLNIHVHVPLFTYGWSGNSHPFVCEVSTCSVWIR
jgi:hypothetical protein